MLKILSPHKPYGRVRLAHKTLTPRFTKLVTDFEKKTDRFAVYIQWVKIFTNSQYNQTPLIRKLKETIESVCIKWVGFRENDFVRAFFPRDKANCP